MPKSVTILMSMKIDGDSNDPNAETATITYDYDVDTWHRQRTLSMRTLWTYAAEQSGDCND